MRYKLRLALVCLMALVLTSSLCLGCAGEEKEAKATIVIGHISDMTGPAATALVSINYAMDDLARYYNEEDLIPGVKLEVAHYDARYDPSRDIPGFDWVREKGAVMVVTALPPTPETLKPFAQQYKVPVFSLTASPTQLEPPGWVFCVNAPTSYLVKTLLKWISENDWDYAQGVPTIGSAGWDEPFAISCRDAIREYAQDHPDQFEWVAGLLAPLGVMTWSGEVGALKGCDYVFTPTTGTGTSTFIRELRNAQYTGTLVATTGQAAFVGLIVDTVGWSGVDGMLDINPCRWSSEASPLVSLAKGLLYEHHGGEAEEIIYSGSGYVGGFQQIYPAFRILQDAIEEVGAENVDGQAIYDAATTFTITLEGYEDWNFTQTKRYLYNHAAIWEWSAQEEDIVTESGWLPLLQE